MFDLRKLPTGSLIGQIEREAYGHAVFLTYGLDIPFFDSAILRHLVGRGCSNIAVFADARHVSFELLRLTESGLHSRSWAIGKYYSLTPVHHSFAFHPKVTLLVGDKVELFVGSGNLEPGGMRSNVEVFHRLECDREDPTDSQEQACIADAWRYISKEAAARKSRFVKFQLEQVEEAVPWLKSPQGPATAIRFVSGPGGSLVDELADLIHGDEVQSLFVVSPFFDHKLSALSAMISRLKPRQTLMLLQLDSVSCPLDHLRKVKNLKVYDLGELKGRYLHAKVVIAECKRRSVLLAGSHNVTSQAFDGHNYEAGMIRVAMDGQRFSAEMGIAEAVRNSRPIDLSNCQIRFRHRDSITGHGDQGLLVAAEFDGRYVEITTRSQLDNSWRLIPYLPSGEGRPLEVIPAVDTTRLQFEIEDPPTASKWVAVALIRSDVRSAPVPLLHLQDLFDKTTANPRRRLASMIRGGISSLSTVEALVRDFNMMLLSGGKSGPGTKRKPGSKDSELPGDNVQQLSYEDFIVPWQQTQKPSHRQSQRPHDLDLIIRAIASVLGGTSKPVSLPSLPASEELWEDEVLARKTDYTEEIPDAELAGDSGAVGSLVRPISESPAEGLPGDETATETDFERAVRMQKHLKKIMHGYPPRLRSMCETSSPAPSILDEVATAGHFVTSMLGRRVESVELVSWEDWADFQKALLQVISSGEVQFLKRFSWSRFSFEFHSRSIRRFIG